METGLENLKEMFPLEDRDIRTYSPLTLAYIGDGVYELVIRTILVKKGNCPVIDFYDTRVDTLSNAL